MLRVELKNIRTSPEGMIYKADIYFYDDDYFIEKREVAMLTMEGIKAGEDYDGK